MSEQVDEEEHSLEMHLPYIATVMEGHPFTLVWVSFSSFFRVKVPILVGNLSNKAEAEYGALLRPYLEDEHTLFVISSDFCHWGKRYRYQHTDPTCKHIYQGIEKLDRQV